jgi:hypothetical protein
MPAIVARPSAGVASIAASTTSRMSFAFGSAFFHQGERVNGQPQQTQPANASLPESAMSPPSPSIVVPLLPPLLLAVPLLLPPLLEPLLLVEPPVGVCGVVESSEHAAVAASETPSTTTEWKSFDVFIAMK